MVEGGPLFVEDVEEDGEVSDGETFVDVLCELDGEVLVVLGVFEFEAGLVGEDSEVEVDFDEGAEVFVDHFLGLELDLVEEELPGDEEELLVEGDVVVS